MCAISAHFTRRVLFYSSMTKSDWCDGVKQTRVLVAPLHIPGVNGGTTEHVKGRLLSLCHPKTGEQACYLFGGNSLQELHWFKRSYQSWFLGNYICEDGSLYFATSIDPVFLFLPLFEKARMKTGSDRGMFRELNDILYVDNYPGYQDLLAIAESSMKLLCEVKEIGTSKFFRLDESKVLAWLCLKADNLKEALITSDKNYAAQGEKNAVLDAISLLGEYINVDPWLKLLCNQLKLELPDFTEKPLCSESSLSVAANIFCSPPSQVKSLKGGSTASTGKNSKKLKTQVDSQNIKDMFRRVTRNG